MALAHSPNSTGVPQELSVHLTHVAELGAEHAAKFGAEGAAYRAGLWHDIGKFHPAFQAYLRNPDAAHGPDHKAAGALLASRHSQPLAFVIAGHHGGLPSLASLKAWLANPSDEARRTKAIQLACQAIPDLIPSQPIPLPSFVSSGLDSDFLLRMLFSALVDGDFLDTEKHFHPENVVARRSQITPAGLWPVFENNQRSITGLQTDAVNVLRHQVYLSCLTKAELPPGFFRLTVPTGGGKTRSALAFALRHAIKFNLDRVIVAIPYTSIIDQVAAEYRGIFGADAVLEHHSALPADDDPENPTPAELWNRLASENWDAPIVVSTTVQLFESLFSNKPSRCRKLHNLARSVIVLDEVQTLPSRLLEPILDALRQLTSHYGATVVLCTATQPGLDQNNPIQGLPDVREIAPDPQRLFSALRRVSYVRPPGKMRWAEVAAEMETARQALAIVNTKRDAIALLGALDDPHALHLSTLLCGAHRRDTLRAVRERLLRGESCCLASTQVVEAGVDLDFRLVLRALGPMDRIVQAAGRCNREGKLSPDEARVVVFDPLDAAPLPPGEYRTATAATRALLGEPGFDFNDPMVYGKYFHMLFQSVDLDAEKVQAARESLDFPEVARKFRMIPDDTVPVAVRYRGPDGKDLTADELILGLRRYPESFTRESFRRLQPYLVNVRSCLIPQFTRDGLVADLRPGLWEWLGAYDAVKGLVAENRDPEELVI